MTERKRVLGRGVALITPIGCGVLALVVSLGYSYSLAMLLSLGGSFTIAGISHRLYPTMNRGLLWRFGGLVFVIFVVGNALTPNGIFAAVGTAEPHIVGGIWIISLLTAYGVVVISPSTSPDTPSRSGN